MTHKQIVREATEGNLVFLYVYRNLRLDHSATPPAHARQVFGPKPVKQTKFKTDKERVRENQKYDHRFNNPSDW